jgi:putative ABC transport system substrate-binding protein
MSCRRRTILVLLTVALQALPHVATAQPGPKVARIGVLLYGTPEKDPNLAAFKDGLHDLGYVEGRNVRFEYRFAEAQAERLPGLAAELVKLEPHVIFALGGDVAPFARAATNTIPIVMATSNDPVHTQLVASLARPGANVTGVTLIASDLAGKRLELLKDIVPTMSRIGILWNPDHPDPEYRETRVTARQLGLQLHSLEVRRRADFDAVFAQAAASRLEAIIVVSSRLMTLSLRPIAEFAAKHRTLLVSGWGPWASAGALFSYGPDLDATVRRTAAQVDKILKGAKPADLPVEQPTKFELVVNTKTAKAFGLTLPASILVRADKIIE